MKEPLSNARTSLVLTARSFLAILLKPRLDHGQDGTATLSARALWFSLLLLSLSITAMFGAVAIPVMLLTGTVSAEALQGGVMRSPLRVFLAMIVLGPLVEEVMFRGWLSGTWRAFTGSGLFVAILLGGSFVMPSVATGWGVIAWMGPPVLAMLALWLVSPLDSGKRLPGFPRAFPHIFWAQGLIFGAMHLKNVSAGSIMVSLLSTLPLIVCGWLWAYARLKIGLAAAVMLHAAYNVPAVAGIAVMRALRPA